MKHGKGWKDLSNPIPEWAEHGADRGSIRYGVTENMDTPNPEPGEIARGYATFDHWVAEVPSQTFTNRSFFRMRRRQPSDLLGHRSRTCGTTTTTCTHPTTSVIGTMRERWELGKPFTGREATASDLAPLLTRDKAREPEDWPASVRSLCPTSTGDSSRSMHLDHLTGA